MINVSASFGDGSVSSGIGTRVEVYGGVYSEFGMYGLIRFSTPPAFIDNIINLQ
jgi:archaellin